jgi:hypothetical protein
VIALILVCALSIAAPDCQRETATRAFYSPDAYDNLSGCLTNGTLYAAQSRLVTAGFYPKIVCQPPYRKK